MRATSLPVAVVRVGLASLPRQRPGTAVATFPPLRDRAADLEQRLARGHDR